MNLHQFRFVQEAVRRNLNLTEAAKALSIMQIQAGGGEVRLFSALNKKGVDDVALLLWQWTHNNQML
mgnify:CR=1 FL=1